MKTVILAPYSELANQIRVHGFQQLVVDTMPLDGIKIERFSALMNGVFVGVGIIFLIWGATDIAFPITERMNVAVFGLTRIILGIISLSVGIGIESVQWAKMGKELGTRVQTASSNLGTPDSRIDQPHVEATTQPAPTSQQQQ